LDVLADVTERKQNTLYASPQTTGAIMTASEPIATNAHWILAASERPDYTSTQEIIHA